jgi:nucleoside-diphosphate-sugar epimerase
MVKVKEMEESSKVLVTGGVGFIGSHLVDALMLLIACDKLKFMGARCY